jgi:dihydroxy-acid dehydratase
MVVFETMESPNIHTELMLQVVRCSILTEGRAQPEQLKTSAVIMGANLRNVALITDGRYSGGTYRRCMM